MGDSPVSGTNFTLPSFNAWIFIFDTISVFPTIAVNEAEKALYIDTRYDVMIIGIKAILKKFDCLSTK